MDEMDWPNLNARLKQNSVQEKLSNLWLDYLLRKRNVIRCRVNVKGALLEGRPSLKTTPDGSAPPDRRIFYGATEPPQDEPAPAVQP